MIKQKIRFMVKVDGDRDANLYLHCICATRNLLDFFININSKKCMT